VVTNDGQVMAALAEAGAGLTYAFEPEVMQQLRSGRLKVVLEAYAPTVPGAERSVPRRCGSSSRRRGSWRCGLSI